MSADVPPQDRRESHKYRTEIPNIIDDLNISPHAYRLYGRIKRVCGDLGVCRDGVRELAEACRMSHTMVTRAKRELKENGLIQTRGVKGRDEIRVVNIWRRNYGTFAAPDDEVESGNIVSTSPDESGNNSSRVETIVPEWKHGFQSGNIVSTPPDPLNRIEEPIKEPEEAEEPRAREGQEPAPPPPPAQGAHALEEPIDQEFVERVKATQEYAVEIVEQLAQTFRVLLATGQPATKRKFLAWLPHERLRPALQPQLACVAASVSDLQPHLRPPARASPSVTAKCDYTCPLCRGSDWELVPGKGARRCSRRANRDREALAPCAKGG